jgi:hypothetical protein
MTPRRVDARDVLDADATTSRAFSGRIVGAYRRSGPNSWDDYELVDEDGGTIEVFAQTPIQVEEDGATFRMRRKGEVVLVAWTPEDGRHEAGEDLRARFLRSCVRDEDPTPEGNLGVWLHGELDRKPEPHD